MENLIILGIIAFIVGTAAGYILMAKKRGVKCIGCPDSKNCFGTCGSCSGCCGK